jgi:uncharacterized membrane protein
MANFCAKCGAALGAGAKFCPECGAPGADAPAGAGATAAAGPAAGSAASGGETAGAGLQPNLVHLLCYLAGFITGLIFLNTAPYNQDPDTKFHAWQSIFVSIVGVAAYVVLSILGSVLGALHMFFLAVILYRLLGVGFLVLWIWLMVQAHNGKRFKLPIIGDLAEKQAAK